VSEIEKQLGRADYRLAHWMRAILPTVSLADVPPVGFMPLPGSGDVLHPDGSNAAFDWGTPEQPARHLPKEVAVLRARKRDARKVKVALCRACLGPTDARKRCANRVNPKAGVEDGWLALTCGVHKASAVFELRDGESWCPEAEAGEQPGPEGGSDAVQAAADSTDPKPIELDAEAQLVRATASNLRS